MVFDLRRRVDTALGERRFRAARGRSQAIPEQRVLRSVLQELDDRESARRRDDWLMAREWRQHSQNGEDGIIDAIFEQIGTTDRQFVEIGSSDGEENCTRTLVERGWGGVWVEGDRSTAARAELVVGERGVKVVNAYVDRANVSSLLAAHSVGEEFDLLVIDVDGNDYWLWKALARRYRPRVVVVEYNGSLGPRSRWVLPYRSGHRWDDTAHHGASLCALADLARSNGYVLVACDSAGVNAFFVRGDVAGSFERRSAGDWFVPPVHTLPFGHPFSRPEPRRTETLPPDDVLMVVLDWCASREATPNAGVYLIATIQNLASLPIGSDLPVPVRLTWNWIRSDGSRLHQWGRRAWTWPWSLAPGASVQLPCRAVAPSEPGEYALELALVQEGVRWMAGPADIQVPGFVVSSS